LGISAVALAALLGSILGAAKLFLGSNHFKTMLTERLQDALKGSRLRIADVDVGVNSTCIHEVVLVEENNDNSWAKIERIDANVPILNLLDGSPEGASVNLQNFEVTLRFDKHNHLTTELPEKSGPLPALPVIELRHGSLALVQEGREPFRLSNLSGKAKTSDGKLLFTGQLADPTWGNWSVSIIYDPGADFKEVKLKTTGVAVKQAMLSALPFVSSNVWTHVECWGDTTADITLRMPSKKAPLQYRIELEPSHTSVHISSVALDAREASGRVVIDDGLVTLAGISGQVAKGNITTNATLDFRKPEYIHHFAVGVQKLELQLLPPKWKIPPTLRGLASGNAELTVNVIDRKVETTGQGEGYIDGARMGLLTLAKPLRIRMIADATGFHFVPVSID
jgi:hypothetical protein